MDGTAMERLVRVSGQGQGQWSVGGDRDRVRDRVRVRVRTFVVFRRGSAGSTKMAGPFCGGR